MAVYVGAIGTGVDDIHTRRVFANGAVRSADLGIVEAERAAFASTNAVLGVVHVQMGMVCDQVATACTFEQNKYT
jgi:hypothetical protein